MNNSLKDFLAFRRMIVPVLIQVIYWVLTAFAVMAGIVSILGGIVSLGVDRNWESLVVIGGGCIALVVGPIVLRIIAEFVLVIFRISETLTDIRATLREQANP